MELPGGGRGGRSGRPPLGGWSGGTSRPRAERALAARTGKSSCENRPRAGRSESEGIVRGGTRSTTRLEEASTPKSPNGFASTSARKSAMELLQLEDSTEAEGQGLTDMTGVEERELPGTTGAEGWGLPRAPETEGRGLPGSPEPEALSAIIKIRFTKLMSMIELISYLRQR